MSGRPATEGRSRTWVKVAAVAAVQLVLVGVAVAPRLSAYATGEEYRLVVAGVDPWDPFRGAYTQLGYPGLEPDESGMSERPAGELFVPLVAEGDLWLTGEPVQERPADGPYLTCESDGWRIDCGIESWFSSPEEARRLEDALSRRTGVATVRVDSRGHAVLVDLEVE